MTLFDSSDPSVINSAVGWLETTLLGTIATTVAILAIASIGFLMIAGRIDLRRAAQVVFGCFIIFGASTIANGIIAAIHGGTSSTADLTQVQPPRTLPSPPVTAHAPSTPYDPYAGAALPSR
jgi:type IV secretory pathway VirB2 component (pilin)